MKKSLYLWLWVVLICTSCEYKFKSVEDAGDETLVEVKRYDRLESRYLTTGDFSALQQMNTEYPMETRTLIEDVLKLGQVNNSQINSKFLSFYQDSLLQILISDAEAEYANMDDLNQQFSKAFANLREWLPEILLPHIYSQITALDQSIIIGDGTIGISLDKYMGEDYPLYKQYYTDTQRKTMTRNYIVPDALSFYLLSFYPMKGYEQRSQRERDLHMGKVMWVVNKAVGKDIFQTDYVRQVAKYMGKNPKMTVGQLLNTDDYSQF